MLTVEALLWENSGTSRLPVFAVRWLYTHFLFASSPSTHLTDSALPSASFSGSVTCTLCILSILCFNKFADDTELNKQLRTGASVHTKMCLWSSPSGELPAHSVLLLPRALSDLPLRPASWEMLLLEGALLFACDRSLFFFVSEI